MYDAVEFRHLKYFVAVAEEGNFSRAAERLHVAQSSLSFQMKQLEESIPAQLFVRENSGVKLTPAGDALMPYAKRLLRIRDQALEATSAINSGKAPPFQLGFSLFIHHAAYSIDRTRCGALLISSRPIVIKNVIILQDGRRSTQF